MLRGLSWESFLLLVMVFSKNLTGFIADSPGMILQGVIPQGVIPQGVIPQVCDSPRGVIPLGDDCPGE